MVGIDDVLGINEALFDGQVDVSTLRQVEDMEARVRGDVVLEGVEDGVHAVFFFCGVSHGETLLSCDGVIINPDACRKKSKTRGWRKFCVAELSPNAPMRTYIG